MGVSTDAILCYGIPFPEGYEFVWREDGIDDWWPIQCGMDPKGEDESWLDFYKRQHEFEKLHPIPALEIRHCSDGYPMYIIAAAGHSRYASRGYPAKIDTTIFNVSDEVRLALIEFCKKYCPPVENDEYPELEPAWYLCSFWG